jgi:hypothetical protein
MTSIEPQLGFDHPHAPWWAVLPGIGDGWVALDHLARVLMAREEPWRLDAVAGEGDAVLKQVSLAKYPRHTLLGAFEIEGLTVVALCDPCDDLRSSCDFLRAIPGLSLPTRLPRFAVRAQLVEHGGNGREEALPEDTWSKPLLQLVSVDTGDALLDVGTIINDSLYPCGRMDANVWAMQRARPYAEALLLNEGLGTPEGRTARASQRL